MLRWRNQQRFGEETPVAGEGAGFGRFQGLVGGGILMAFVLTFVWSALAGQTTASQHPQLFGGSMVLDDRRPLVVLDLATGAVTVRLQDVFTQVGAATYGQVQAVPIDGGTVLVNRLTGSFNVLGKDNYVIKRTPGGVGLGPLDDTTGAMAIAAGSSAYIVRFSPGSSTISLIGPDTVEAAVRATGQRAASGGAPLTGPGAATTVAPRGFAALGGHILNHPGTAVTADGDLWTVLNSSGQRQVVQLRPSPSSPLGLAVVNRQVAGPVGIPAALEATPAGGRTWVGLALPGRVRLYDAGRASGSGGGYRDIVVPPTAGATDIVPTTGAQGTLWWLVQRSSGWSVLGLMPSGRVIGPHDLAGVAPGAQLVAPVWSGGRLYTMDRAAAGLPALLEVDPSKGTVMSPRGAARYPLANAAERADFTDAEVLVRGPRVIFDNPDSLLGMVIFTDGSHPPVVIDKSAATNVSAVGPNPSSATRTEPSSSAAPPGTTGPNPPTALQPVAPQVSQQVTCANTTQKPRSPQLTQVVPTAHTATVTWSYPLLDNQDCEPDSWLIHVQALGAPQPSQPSQLVRGQLQYQFAGLRPAVNYRVVVTALIKQQATASPPLSFTTLPTGPDPPASVSTTADGNGNWIVSWVPCTAAGCYVPADVWTVTGAACGSGFVGQPPTLAVSGAETTITVDAAARHLLGASLTFHVQGKSISGLTGDSTGDRACTEAWLPPDPAHIALQASGLPAGAPPAQSVTAQMAVSTGEDPSDAFGSNLPEFTYQVAAAGQTPATAGPTTAMTASITGLTPGQQYQTSVTVTPRNHPQAAVTINGPPITQNLAWPSDLAVHATAAVDPSNPNQGALTATFTDLPKLALAAAGSITCGSYRQPVGGDLQNGQLMIQPLDLVVIGSNCDLALQLSETQTRYYGVASPQVSATFSVPATQPDQSSFTATYGGSPSNPQVIVSGMTQNKGANWQVAITNLLCLGRVARSPAPLPFPLTFQLGLIPCNLGQPVVLNISWTYLGAHQSFSITATGVPPTTTTTTTTTVPPPTSSTVKSAAAARGGGGPGGEGAQTMSALGAGGLPPTGAPATRSSDLVIAVGLPGWALASFAIRKRRPRRTAR